LAEAAALERILPGLSAMSSAYGASRADSGLCRIHEVFRRPADGCADHAPNVPIAAAI
jgi:hypothetical protein